MFSQQSLPQYESVLRADCDNKGRAKKETGESG